MEEPIHQATEFSTVEMRKGSASSLQLSLTSTSPQSVSPATTSASDSAESTSGSHHKSTESRNSVSSHALYGEKLDGFDLDAVCSCCGKNAVWAAVQCGADDCCCKSADWELCEACCEELLHDQCVSKQIVDNDPIKAFAETVPSYPQDNPETAEPKVWYGPQCYGCSEYQACEPDPSWSFSNGEYQKDAAWFYDWENSCVDQGYDYIPTVAELEAHGVDLNTLCVDFLANGRCARGPACRWIHCRA